jgi:exoribonuclease R
MSVKIRSFVGKWKDVLILVSLIISMGVFLTSSSKSSGRQEQSLIDIKTEQTEQKKSLTEFKAETIANKTAQDAINTTVTIALTNITNNNARTASLLRALGIDHAKLMKLHNIYPEPIDFNLHQERAKSSEEKTQTSNGKMKPFPQ